MSDEKYSRGITRENLKEAVEYIFGEERPKFKERTIKFMSYCRGIDGPKSYTGNEWNLCDHSECKICRSLEKAFTEEIRLLETHEELSAKEIIERYGDLLSEETIKQLKKYTNDINNLIEENKQLKSSIMSWRKNIEKHCNELLYISVDKNNDMDEQDMTDLIEMCNEPLKSFDEHFNITKQRQGKI